MEYSRAFNFIVMGDIGKSHFRRNFCEGHFNMENPVKLGVEYGSRKEYISGEPILINLWEAASKFKILRQNLSGLASFRSLVKNYYHGATAAFLIYDKTNRSTFEDLKEWVDVTRWSFPHDVHFTLVATNTDLEKESAVSADEAKKFAEENNMRFEDIGAAEKKAVEELVIRVADECWERIKRGDIDERDLINGVIRVEPTTKGIARCF